LDFGLQSCHRRAEPDRFTLEGDELAVPRAWHSVDPQSQVETSNEQLNLIKQDLAEAVERLDEHYDELKSAAREQLGSLFNEADYPQSLQGLFDVTWDFPSLDVPDYLRQLRPELYQQECERVAPALTKLCSWLSKRLSRSCRSWSRI